MGIAGYNKNVTAFTVQTDTGSVGTFYVMTAPPGGMRLHGASVAVERSIGTGGADHMAASLINGGSVGESTDVLGAYGGASVGLSANRPYALDLSNNASEVGEGSAILFKYSKEAAADPSRLSLSIEWTQGGDQS